MKFVINLIQVTMFSFIFRCFRSSVSAFLCLTSSRDVTNAASAQLNTYLSTKRFQSDFFRRCFCIMTTHCVWRPHFSAICVDFINISNLAYEQLLSLSEESRPESLKFGWMPCCIKSRFLLLCYWHDKWLLWPVFNIT